jgi:hypothetical protein
LNLTSSEPLIKESFTACDSLALSPLGTLITTCFSSSVTEVHTLETNKFIWANIWEHLISSSVLVSPDDMYCILHFVTKARIQVLMSTSLTCSLVNYMLSSSTHCNWKVHQASHFNPTAEKSYLGGTVGLSSGAYMAALVCGNYNIQQRSHMQHFLHVVIWSHGGDAARTLNPRILVCWTLSLEK